MAKKLYIFVSSRISDVELKEERETARKVIIKTGSDPLMWEDFGAASKPPDERSLEKVKECNIFVQILDRTMGETQIIKDEYNTAKTEGKSIIIFVKKEEHRDLELVDYIKSLESDISCMKFSAVEDFEVGLTKSLFELVTEKQEQERESQKLKLRHDLYRELGRTYCMFARKIEPFINADIVARYLSKPSNFSKVVISLNQISKSEFGVYDGKDPVLFGELQDVFEIGTIYGDLKYSIKDLVNRFGNLNGVSLPQTEIPIVAQEVVDAVRLKCRFLKNRLVASIDIDLLAQCSPDWWVCQRYMKKLKVAQKLGG